MKKLTWIAVLLVALLALVLPAAAQDESDLTALARYLPGDSPLFAAFRTDDDIIDSLDTLASKIGALTPGGWTPGSLMDMLDSAASELQPGGTFATVFRSWLGDSAAIGMYELREQSFEEPVPPITIAIRITDQDAAEAFLDTMPNAERYTLSEGDDYTLYTPTGSTSSDPYFLFRDDVVLITGDAALAEAGGTLSDSLVDSTDFTTAVGMLPADSYAALVYSDTPAILETYMQSSMTRRDQEAMESLSSLLAAVQPQAIGLTVLDDRSVTLDIASPLDADAAGSFMLTSAGTPVDPTFLQHIPASTPLVVQGTDLYGNFQSALDNLRALAEMSPSGSGMTSKDLQTAMLGINFVVRGLTGMEMDQALGWMTGNYALAVGFSPSFSDISNLTEPLTRNPVDFGIVIEATDADAAQALFDGLKTSLDSMATDTLSIDETTLDDGTDAISLTFTGENADFPIEVQIAAGSGVFAIGTPRMVGAALNPPDVGLDSDPSFVEASRYLLDGANSILFVSGSNLEPLAHALTASGNPLPLRQQGKQVQAVLDLINSISFSAAVAPDHSGTVTRIVWTLP